MQITDDADTDPPPRLRTVLCTCGGLYGALVLRRLRACERLDVCAVVRSSRVLDPTFGLVRGALGQIRRSGVRYALYLWCTTTLADWLCSLSAVGAVPTRSVDSGPRVFTTRDINGVQGLQFVAECAPDLLISSFFNQRFRSETLAIPTIACLNIHPSLLPDAKGVDPVFQALLHGGPPLGMTVHFMNPEFDAGGIMAQQPVEPRRGASVFELTALLYRDGAELLASVIGRVAAGDRGTAQSGPGTYQSWPTAAETAALRRQGGALLRFMDFVRLARARLPR
jgi:methionyl-tRNA formyltransferase